MGAAQERPETHRKHAFRIAPPVQDRTELPRGSFDELLLLHPDDVAALSAIYQKSLANPGKVLEVGYRYRHKNGSWVHLEAVGCNLLDAPNVQGIVLNIRDVSERVQAEQEQKKLQHQLQQAMKMEAVGRLAGERLRTMELQGGHETVLLVEDEPIVRKSALKILQWLGYNTLQAGGGEAALALAERTTGPIHLLFTDVVMPGINGNILADRLAKIHPETRVLYASGYTENAIAHHGVIDEGLNFIGKPYAPRTLAEAIRKALDDE